MIPDLAVNQLQQYLKTYQPPLIQVGDSVLDTPQSSFLVGQQVKAHVLSQLPTGRFAVDVKNQTLDLNLPKNTQPGESFEMSVVSTSPKLTFALNQDLKVLQQKFLPQTNNQVNFSDTAKVLSNLLFKSPAATTVNHQATVYQTAPILNQPEDIFQTPKLANVLQNALSNSGLFYESHQAEWVTGQRGLQTLWSEPQAKWPAQLGLEGAEKSLSEPFVTKETEPFLNVKKEEGVSKLMLKTGLENMTNLKNNENQNFSVRNNSTGANNESQIKGLASFGFENVSQVKMGDSILMPPQKMIENQLAVLDSRQFQWQGQIWHGQDMQWHIEERNEASQEEEVQSVWYTRMRLDLPKLGEIEARVRMGPEGAQLIFVAKDAVSREKIAQFQDRLSLQFELAGLKLASSQVLAPMGDL